jgi:hypothetical protein
MDLHQESRELLLQFSLELAKNDGSRVQKAIKLNPEDVGSV